MSEVTAHWISVGSRTFQRTEAYTSALWSRDLPAAAGKIGQSGRFFFSAAPFGGPILIWNCADDDNTAQIYLPSGPEISCFRINKGIVRTLACDWSNYEELVAVLEDGTVLMFDILGKLLRSFNLGQEAKDLKLAKAVIFRGSRGTGVAALTNGRRFFIVNNVLEPRIRKMPDIDMMQVDEACWAVLADERQARIAVAKKGSSFSASVSVVSQTDVQSLMIDSLSPGEGATVIQIVPSASFSANGVGAIAVLFSTGLLWMGTTERKMASVRLNSMPDCIAWCASDAVLLFYASTSICQIVTARGDKEEVFLPDFLSVTQEVDGARVFNTSGGQELIREVPNCILEAFSIGSVAPSALLRFAAEEFARQSHRADEYLREIPDRVDVAVAGCIECAGHMFDTQLQKDLLRAAQFGKSFLVGSSPTSSTVAGGGVDAFAEMCVALRVLNTLRSPRIGVPLTKEQYDFLTPQVVVDRLLARRLYPLAVKICHLLKLPAKDGENRVLAHWACYKVSSCGEGDDEASVAKAINQRLGHHHPQLSYSDIAAKAADCGKKELAVRILEHETRVHKQVPLLVQLGQESAALTRALASGNRDLAFSVILHLRSELSSSDFHILIRKYPLGKLLFENYCRQHDDDALEDWFVQEDDFVSLARRTFVQAHDTNRYETRMTRLLNAQDFWRKAAKGSGGGSDAYPPLVEDELKLLKTQSVLEDKLGTRNFVGLTATQTVMELLMLDQQKHAEKLKTDMKMSDRRFAWLKIKALVRQERWDDIKKFMKQSSSRRSSPPLLTAQVVRIVHDLAGEEKAKEFLTEDLVSNYTDRVNLFSDFGMFLEAANAAFVAKSLESLTLLEARCMGKEDVLKAIANFKTRLLTK